MSPPRSACAQAGLVVTPVVLLAAAAIWLLLATGAVGRIVLFCEELAHRRSALAMLSRDEDTGPRPEAGAVDAQAPAVIR